MSRTMEGFFSQETTAGTHGRLDSDTTVSPIRDKTSPRERGREADNTAELVFQGKPLSPGIGFGRACFYHTPQRTQSCSRAAGDDTARLRGVMKNIAAYLEQLGREADQRLNRAAGDIFRAQRMLVEDPLLIETLENTLKEVNGCTESAITLTFDRIMHEMRAATLDAIRERADDFAELQDLISAQLSRQSAYLHCQDLSWCIPGECRNGCDHVLIATRLSPGTTIGANSHTMGFVVENGGPSSHAAILARMMGLPAVSGIPNLPAAIPPDSQVLVDGDSGKVYVNPSLETLAHYHGRSSGCARIVDTAIAPVPGFRVMADLERTEDIPWALAAQAEGIGLYRSETEPLMLQRCLTEDEQVERYIRLLDTFPNGPVCVRLLDLGADKAADWLHLPPEDNPALGYRGARLLLAQPELLIPQARALARASRKACLQVLYPMVHSLSQFLQLRELFDSAISDIPDTQLSHGVMFEVPSACMEARAFFDYVDFGRIGTNDLTQYLFAVDRTNSAIDQHELFDHPALWKLIEDISMAATKTGKPLSICGELAADPKYTHRLIETGITGISVCPRHITVLRQAAAS
jgi:phosphoenolpyruvate-protein kinase (PTS system EI component)